MTDITNYIVPPGQLLDFIDYYLLDTGGDRWAFRKNLETGQQRIGQAFFNALTPQDQEALRGKPFDPFFTEDRKLAYTKIMECLDFLTKK